MKRSRSAVLLQEPSSPISVEETAILSVPADVLRLIFTYVLGAKKRARWGLLATLRLVCRKFRRAFPADLLHVALKQDFSEFVSFCIIEEEFPFGYKHFYVLTGCDVARAYHAQFLTYDRSRRPEEADRCAKHTHMICDTIHLPEPRFVTDVWWLPHEKLMKAWRNRLYQTLLDFRNNISDKDDAGQQNRFYYAVSSTYHTYFRGLVEQGISSGRLKIVFQKNSFSLKNEVLTQTFARNF